MANDDINRLKKKNIDKRTNKPSVRNNGDGKVLSIHQKLLKTEKEQGEEIKSIQKQIEIKVAPIKQLKVPVNKNIRNLET